MCIAWRVEKEKEREGGRERAREKERGWEGGKGRRRAGRDAIPDGGKRARARWWGTAAREEQEGVGWRSLVLLGHGSEFSMVPSRAQPSPVPQPSCPSLCSSRAAYLPPRSGTTGATRPPRLCVSFCFGGASTMHLTHGVQRSPGVRLHSAAPRVYLPMNLSPAEANPVRGSSRVARPAGGLRRGREGGRD